MPAGRDLLASVLAVAAYCAIAVGAVSAQPAARADASYPRQPIRIVVGFGTGGGNDIVARIVGQKLGERLGQPVVVDNKPGAGGLIAVETVQRAAPDGYTLLVAPNSVMVFNAALYKHLSYDPQTSFVPITIMAAFPFYVTVGADLPIRSVAELVAWAKANPEKANYGSTSGVFQLTTELFKQKTGAPFEHIPFKGTAEMITAVISGQSTMALIDPPPLLGQLKAGKVRALANTASQRSAELPEVPTLAEAGVPGIEVEAFSGLVAPAGTPAEIVRKLETEMNDVLRLPEVTDRFRQLAVHAVGGTSEQFAAMVAGEIPLWKDVARKANIALD